MPMSPRLLRPRASAALVAVDADARAYINAVRIADGGQSMEPAVQLAIDAFVTGCKTDGIWSAIKASCILMGARTLAGALTPLVGAGPTNVNNGFVSGDYNRETGLVGDGVGKYLDSGRNNSADSQNSQHVAVYASAAASGAADSTYIGGGGSAAGSTNISRGHSTNILFWRSRTSSGIQQTGNAGSNSGLIGVSRAASGSYTSRTAGTNATRTAASQTPASANIFVFASSDTSNNPSGYSNARLAFYSIGESLDLALLDSRITTLYNAIGAAL